MPSPRERAAEAALLHLHGTESGHILTDAPKHPQEDKSIRKLARALLRFAAAEGQEDAQVLAGIARAYQKCYEQDEDESDLMRAAGVEDAISTVTARAAEREKAAEEGPDVT